MKINQVTFGEIGRLNPAQLIRLLHLRVATGVAANRNSETRRRSAAPAQRRREHDLPVESDSGGYPPIISDFFGTGALRFGLIWGFCKHFLADFRTSRACLWGRQ
jgi:hypothetical protein